MLRKLCKKLYSRMSAEFLLLFVTWAGTDKDKQRREKEPVGNKMIEKDKNFWTKAQSNPIIFSKVIVFT